MKSFAVIYKHGHFVDTENQKRIIPIEGERYAITALGKGFAEIDEKQDLSPQLISAEKKKWAEKKFGANNYQLLQQCGQELMFRIGNSKTLKQDEGQEYILKCKLLEDLYIYKLKGKTGNQGHDWRLAECQCTLESCLLGGLIITEPIKAKSLNELFSKTVMFYFNMQRSGAANAFDTFFQFDKDMHISFTKLKAKEFTSLGLLRKDMILKMNPKPIQ